MNKCCIILCWHNEMRLCAMGPWYKNGLLLVAVLFFVSCTGAPRVIVRPNSGFSHRSTVLVTTSGSDEEGVQEKLESALFQRGFNVISSGMSGTELRYSETTIETNSGINTRGSVAGVTEIPAAYALRFTYRTRADFPAGRVFEGFNATVVEMKSGQIVASAEFSQGQFSGKTIDAVIREFVSELSQQIP